MDQHGALCSHAPLAFNSIPSASPETALRSAARLLFRSNWKLNVESARPEPRLRRLLGHASVYDRTKTSARSHSPVIPTAATEENELSTYLQHQVPSFEQFRAALRLQLETISQIKLANTTEYKDAEEYDSDKGSDSSYDSFDGENWSEDENAADSDDSLTDNESEGQSSACTSPTISSLEDEKYDKEVEDEDDVWAIRPLTPFFNSANRVVSPV